MNKPISNLKSEIYNHQCERQFKEGAMKTETSDSQAQLVWTMLAIVGAILSIVGWYRWAV
jgi:hypothetical protein